MMMMLMQPPGWRQAKRTKTATVGSDVPSWRLPGTALKSLVTTYSTLKIAIIIRLLRQRMCFASFCSWTRWVLRERNPCSPIPSSETLAFDIWTHPRPDGHRHFAEGHTRVHTYSGHTVRKQGPDAGNNTQTREEEDELGHHNGIMSKLGRESRDWGRRRQIRAAVDRNNWRKRVHVGFAMQPTLQGMRMAKRQDRTHPDRQTWHISTLSLHFLGASTAVPENYDTKKDETTTKITTVAKALRDSKHSPRHR